MKMRLTVVLVLAMSLSALAQQAEKPSSTAPAATPSATTQSATPAATAAPEAKPEDVKSIDAILGALYDVISGPPGPRDWKRFHSLFIPEARMIPSNINDKGEWRMRVMTPADYEKRAGEFFLKEGFFERGVSNKIDEYGTIAHVFSTYESRHEKDGQPFARGINSIQLVNDGKRWYIATILWQQENPKLPVPEKYLSK